MSAGAITSRAGWPDGVAIAAGFAAELEGAIIVAFKVSAGCTTGAGLGGADDGAVLTGEAATLGGDGTPGGGGAGGRGVTAG